MHDKHCVFCAIASGEAHGHILYRDDLVLAILDINPVTPGHTLVIPRRHVEGLADLTETENAAVFATGRSIAAGLRRSGLRCEGINYFVADGRAAFQEIAHFHLHIFPRFRGDTFRIDADWSNPPGREVAGEDGGRDSQGTEHAT